MYLIYRFWLVWVIVSQMVAVVTSDLTPCFHGYDSRNHDKYIPWFVSGITHIYLRLQSFSGVAR